MGLTPWAGHYSEESQIGREIKGDLTCIVLSEVLELGAQGSTPGGFTRDYPEGTGMMNQWQYGYRPLALLFADA